MRAAPSRPSPGPPGPATGEVRGKIFPRARAHATAPPNRAETVGGSRALVAPRDRFRHPLLPCAFAPDSLHARFGMFRALPAAGIESLRRCFSAPPRHRDIPHHHDRRRRSLLRGLSGDSTLPPPTGNRASAPAPDNVMYRGRCSGKGHTPQRVRTARTPPARVQPLLGRRITFCGRGDARPRHPRRRAGSRGGAPIRAMLRNRVPAHACPAC